MAWSKKKVIWWAVTVTAATVVIMLLIATDRLPGLPPDKVTLTAVSYSKSPSDSKFAVSLQAPIDHPQPDNTIDLTLIFLNWDTHPVQVESLTATQSCPYLQLSTPTPLPSVPARSSAPYTVHLSVDKSCKSEAQPIALFYRARIGDQAGTEVDGYISTPPLVVMRPWRQILARFLALANSLLRLAIVPGALAVLAWMLTLALNYRDARLKLLQDRRDRKFKRQQDERDSERDRRLKRQQRERDERLKSEQEARDRRNEVLNTLISNYRDLVMGDYLPISRRMQTVEAELPEFLKSPVIGRFGPVPNIRSLLCAILLFRARTLDFLTRKGGIYFRSKQAEDLFADLITFFTEETRKRLDKEQFRRVVEMLNPADTLAATLEKCATGITAPSLTAEVIQRNKDDYAHVEEKFLTWVATEPVEFRAYTRLLQIATALLAFECDRPFYQTAPVDVSHLTAPRQELSTTGWYFDPPVLELTLEMWAVPDAFRSDIRSKLTDYLNNIPVECLRKVVYPLP